MLREYGANKISMIVTYPPVRYAMQVLIFPPRKNSWHTNKYRDTVSTTDIAHKVARTLGADFVAYNNTSTLAKAISLPERELCFTYATGDYSSLGVKPLFKSRAVLKEEVKRPLNQIPLELSLR